MLERCVDDWIEAGFAKRVGYSKIKITLKGSIWSYKTVIKAFILEADASPYLSKKKAPTAEKSEAFTVLNSFFDTSYLSEPVAQNESSNSVEDMGSDIEYNSDDTLEKVQPIWARPLAENADDMSTSAYLDHENETSSAESASRSYTTRDDKDSGKANMPETVNSPYNAKHVNIEHEQKATFAGLVAILGFLVVSLFFTLSFFADIWRESQINSWPQAQGTIEYIELIPSSVSTLFDRSPNQQEFDLRYVYEVDGQAYQGSKIFIYGNYASWGSNWSELLEKYGDAGNPVSVHYNSEQPSESVLEVSGPRLGLLIPLFLFVLTFISALLLLIKDIKKRKKEPMHANSPEKHFDNKDKTWKGGVITAVLTLFMLGSVVMAISGPFFEGMRIQSKEEHYAQTRGEVIGFEHEVVPQTRRHRTVDYYDVHIIYEYVVDGQTFQGDVINRFFKDELMDLHRFDSWETMYFEGNEVNVFYNPDQPEHAVLELVVLSDYAPASSLVIGGAMTVILIASLIGMIQKRRRKKYMNEH